MTAGQTRDALAAYRRTLDMQPHNETAALNSAAILTRVESFSQARDILRDFIAAAGATDRAYLKLAEVEARLGNRGESERLMKEGVVLFPESIDMKLALGRYYLITNRNQETIDLLSGEVQNHPSRAPLLETLALAYQGAGQPAEAADLLSRLAELQGGGIAARNLAAQAYLQAGQPEQAVAQLTAGLALSPDNLQSRLLLASTLINEGQLAQAAAHMDKLLEQAPENAAVAELNGRYLTASGNPTEAVAAFRKAVELEPGPSRVRLLAQALWDSSEQEAARAALTEWLETTPGDAFATRLLATFHLFSNDYAAAEPLLQLLAGAFPQDVNLLNNYAVTLLEIGKLEEGASVAERALQLDVENPSVMATVGRARLEQGETAEAVELLEAAVTAVPENADVQILYARALLAAGDKPAAAKVLEELASLDLSTEQAARADALKRQLP